MKRKLLACFMALCLMIGVLPLQAFTVSAAPSTTVMTIAIVDGNGNPISDANVAATRTYETPGRNIRTVNVALTNNGNGVYSFNTAIYYNGTSLYYTVTAEKAGMPSVTQHIDPDTRSVVVMLGEEIVEPVLPDEWVSFDVYYIATGITPASFAGAGAAIDYGPSNNDVPFVTLNVNISKLKSKAYADCVVYEENADGNTYHFIPAGNIESDETTEEQKRKLIKPFWDAVLECMDEDSLKALDATGLSDAFMGYAIKNQGSVQYPDNHIDGILTVEPPVYIVEMNDNGVYFGGFANDEKTSEYTTYAQVLEKYSTHYGREDLQWTDNGSGIYNATYREGKKQYYLEVRQTNAAQATVNPDDNDTAVKYQKQTDQYYLAVFNGRIVKEEQILFTIKYTDGLGGVIFKEQSADYAAGETMPSFSGDTSRENYHHIGWVLQGGDGKVLTQEEILKTYPVVTRDMTFVAAYELKPQTFAGTVEVILNGSYAGSIAAGKRVDITTVKGDMELYVSADGVNFIKLEKTATGVYNAKLKNGSYHIYYYDGESYFLTGHGQQLDIYDAPRTRYLFFNDVTYDLNGGVGGPALLHTYHRTGDAVQVATEIPVKEGYEFLGWLADNGVMYAAGTALTAAINQPYRLTAQWKKINKAKVDLTVIVEGKSLDGTVDKNLDRAMTIELTYRPIGTAEDYVEVVGQSKTFTDGYDSGTTEGDITTTHYPDLFTDLSVAYEYSANAFMGEYEVTERTVDSSTDANGDVTYHVTVKMHYAPEMNELIYKVIEDIVNDALVPSAVDIKVLAFYDPSAYGFPTVPGKQWYPVTQHFDTTHDVLLNNVDANGNFFNNGSYIVWGWEDRENNLPYYYRVSASGVTLKDGTELTLVSADGIHYASLASADGRYPAGAYTAVVSVENGVHPEDSTLGGAYCVNKQQSSDITVTVYAHPYIVTFDPNGGTLLDTTDNTVIPDQFIMPDPNTYVPARDDAYVFDRWVLADENGNPTDQSATVGEALTNDVTLVALWKAPKTIEGLVTVGATYEQENDDGTVTVQKIPEADRPQTAVVLLQRIAPNGYFETVNSVSLELDYSNDMYYYVGRPVGAANYRFENIPDDGSMYRVQLLLPNYVSMFQNEPDSIGRWDWYPEYTLEDYTVLWGTKAPEVGTVNIHNHFDPEEFDLQYEVDATAIGEGFRPDSVELLVTSDANPGSVIPSTWPVISQMVFEDGVRGDDLSLTNGLGNGSTPVWISGQNSAIYYQYGLCVYSTTFGADKIPFDGTQPFTVTYQAPTHYHYGAQEQMLIAYLIPNTYTVNYVLNGGVMNGDYPTTHTWSYETSLDIDDPTLPGFRFMGWYLDKDFTVPAPAVITADVAADTTLYAKWLQVMDTVDLTVIINHDQENGSGLATNYKKDLHVQLTHDDRRNEGDPDREYAAMDGYSRVYPDGLWHTHGDDVTQDIFQVPSFYTGLSSEYDYSANVMLEGYYVQNKTTEKFELPDGSTLHKVVVTLQYNPALLMLNFYVRMGNSITADNMPTSAQVKVTCWSDDMNEDVNWQWFRITQHEESSVSVSIDPETGIGYGQYPVWQWYDQSEQLPYHYRLEVVQLTFADSSTVHMNTVVEDVVTGGAGYTATVETEGGKVPYIADANTTTDLEGVYGAAVQDGYAQQGTLGAVVDLNRVVFHANNESYEGDDVFRTYYYEAMPQMSENDFVLDANNKVPTFYDVPEFDYNTHNEFIFKGWYMDPDSQDEPFNWNASHSGDVHVYAHWIETGTVAQEDGDTKNYTDLYQGYDLVGVQIREAENDPLAHHGKPFGGLRFVTVLKEDVYAEINALKGNEGGAEYGFVMAKTSTADKYAGGADGYTLQYRGENVNGVDTTVTYKYVQNMACNGVVDHYEGETYRLYTAVITYEGMEGDALQQAYETEFTARSYIRYTDANGLVRVYYNNYTGTNMYHGCSTSFAEVQDMME